MRLDPSPVSSPFAPPRPALVAAALAALAGGCGGRTSPTPAPAAGSEAPTAGSARAGEEPAPPGADADAAVEPPAPRPPPPVPVTREARAEYKRRLLAGRKAAKAARWPQAITELEAALAAIPGDERALSELSWAALSAGDFERARIAGHLSVRAATDPAVKAASLYNLGRVEEATGHAAEAAARYRESLALRPNRTVEERLAGLGAAGALADAALPCATPMPEARLCACLNASGGPEDAADAACALQLTDVPELKLAVFNTYGASEQRALLVARQPGGWSVVAHVEDLYNPGMAGIFEEWELGRVRTETVGGKRVYRVTSRKLRADTDAGIDEAENEDTERLVVCVRAGGAGTAITCPLRVVTSYEYVRDRLGLAEDGELADVADLRTRGLPIRARTQVSVELGADGTARVRARAGRPDPATLGDKQLW